MTKDLKEFYNFRPRRKNAVRDLMKAYEESFCSLQQNHKRLNKKVKAERNARKKKKKLKLLPKVTEKKKNPVNEEVLQASKELAESRHPEHPNNTEFSYMVQGEGKVEVTPQSGIWICKKWLDRIKKVCNPVLMTRELLQQLIGIKQLKYLNLAGDGPIGTKPLPESVNFAVRLFVMENFAYISIMPNDFDKWIKKTLDDAREPFTSKYIETIIISDDDFEESTSGHNSECNSVMSSKDCKEKDAGDDNNFQKRTSNNSLSKRNSLISLEIPKESSVTSESETNYSDYELDSVSDTNSHSDTISSSNSMRSVRKCRYF